MRFVLCVTFLLGAVLVSDCLADDPRTERRELGKWVMNYYQNPSPDELVEKAKAMSVNGLLHDSRPSARPDANLMFIGKIMESSPGKIEDWMDQLGSLPDADFAALKRAVWYSGTSQGKEWLSNHGEGELADGPRPVLLSGRRALKMKPYHLDQLWEWFFATGEAEPVNRIISLFSLAHEMPSQKPLELLSPPKKTNDATQRQIQLNNYLLLKPALWSTTSLAIQHDRVLEILQQAQKDYKNEVIQAWLNRVIAIAENQRAKRDDA